MTDIELRARQLVADVLAGRTLSPDILEAIERAVAMQIPDGFSAEMADELRRFVDAYLGDPGGPLPARPPAGAPDDQPTSADVHWTTLKTDPRPK